MLKLNYIHVCINLSFMQVPKALRLTLNFWAQKTLPPTHSPLLQPSAIHNFIKWYCFSIQQFSRLTCTVVDKHFVQNS